MGETNWKAKLFLLSLAVTVREESASKSPLAIAETLATIKEMKWKIKKNGNLKGLQKILKEG